MFFCKKKWICLFFLFTLIHAGNSPKIGLVLSGGGSKGFAHIATLKALDSLNIPIDYIAGTSFGAIVGAMYALGYTGKQIEEMALATDWYEVQNDEPERKFLPYFRKKDTGKYQLDFGLKGVKPVAPTGLIYGQKIILELSKWTRNYEQVYDFDKFPIPFRCNAFDIISGKEVIIKEGSLANALRASISIPTIFAPVEWGDALLVDGGVVNNLPVDIAKEMGADIILAIDVSSPAQTKVNINNMYDIIFQSISVHGNDKWEKSKEAADYLIHPEINNVSLLDYRQSTINYLFQAGEDAVESNWDIFLQLQKLIKDSKKSAAKINPLENPKIRQVTINGNKELPKHFILDYMGIEKGSQLDVEKLDANISQLYSLGYFKTLYYEIHPQLDGRVDILIQVNEGSLRKFQLGIRWDNYYDLVGVANVQLNSNWIPGLRIENQTQFAGIQKNEFSVYYPSRKLNFPLYPFLRITNSKYNYQYYNKGNYGGRYTLLSDGFTTGIGLLLKNYWNTELNYFWKMESFLPENVSQNKEIIAGINLSAQLDLLDDILLPKNGIVVRGKYENSSTEWGSAVNYHMYQGSGDIFFTRKRNTFRIAGYYHQGLNDLPKNLTTISNGSQTFVGLKEFQLQGKTLLFSRFEYRYKHKKDIFAHLILSWLITAKSDDSHISTENILCPGVGITLLSPLGPLEFIWSRGPENFYINESWKNVFHFSAGYKF
ncbi:uncharacterized protein METZ01_LOCUS118901 [marine metagenome]|uniref:PNPLA domain-containing protein n=1 Tax=marine metagenome TaxID=408172 RepID=A0A381XPB1_9ZZZZ